MEIIEVEGPPFAMGEQLGRTCREEIRELYQARIRNAVAQAQTYGGRSVDEAGLMRIVHQCLPQVRDFHPEGWFEIEGIAAGSGLQAEQIWAMNALTDLRDLGAFGDPSWVEPEGCTAVVRGPGSRQRTPILGQTWDLATDNMPFVRLVLRRATAGPHTASMTLVGCLTLIGLSQRGVAVGTTNLRSRDVRPGVGYLDLIHRAIGARDAQQALDVITTAPRAAAHFYMVADPWRAWGAECTATRHTVVPIEDAYVHANHMLHPQGAELEVTGTPMSSSVARQARMESLVAAAPGFDGEQLTGFLSDRQGAELAIERHDFNGISTNGVVIVEPGPRRLHAVAGPASMGTWVTVDL